MKWFLIFVFKTDFCVILFRLLRDCIYSFDVYLLIFRRKKADELYYNRQIVQLNKSQTREQMDRTIFFFSTFRNNFEVITNDHTFS